MRAKGEECSKLTAERDLLATQLAEQKELLKKFQEEAEEKETPLQVSWVIFGEKITSPKVSFHLDSV